MTVIRRALGVLAGLAFTAALTAPAAGARPVDITDGGRLASGSSQLRVPQGLRIGSVGGPELSQVDRVDIGRYAGRWFQVAAVPQPFTLQCRRDVIAEYEVIGPAEVSVRNTCVTPWGAPSGIEGSATVVDPAQPASLRVVFPGVPFQDPNGPANYRITYLADDYTLAIVGDPSRRSGFVLSRTPGLSPDRWTAVRSIVESRGWWPCAFLTTPQVGGRADLVPMCTIG